MEQTIVVICLANGMEVIGKVDSESDEVLTLADPHIIHSEWQKDGSVNFGFIPFMIYAKGNKVGFNSASMIGVAYPEDGMEREFRQRTSGIILPK